MPFLEELIGQELIYGHNDCNLVVLKVLGSGLYDELQGRYTTKIGGFRVANKVVKEKMISEWLNREHTNVEINFRVHGDVLVNPMTQDCLVCVGGNFLGVCSKTNRYRIYKIGELDLMEYICYRRK